MLTLPPLLVRYSKNPERSTWPPSPERLPELMQRFENTNLSLMTRCLLKWQLLTLVRPVKQREQCGVKSTGEKTLDHSGRTVNTGRPS